MVEGFLNLCKNGFEKEAVEASCFIVLFCVLFCIVLGVFFAKMKRANFEKTSF